MSRQEENQKRREYSDRLRQHIASRLYLPECQELRLKIDCLCSRHYAPDSEEARQYIEKAKNYNVKRRLHFIRLYQKRYDELLYKGWEG
ncbi:hypothetical protein [Lactococcus garvieae]|uniref:hypothetical protein n=1 Tax=Lactococcus garvieae TaxID=1363 RepID=UPI00254FA628|nr:hypothetical protein [Lactococcus garvieae]